MPLIVGDSHLLLLFQVLGAFEGLGSKVDRPCRTLGVGAHFKTVLWARGIQDVRAPACKQERTSDK